MLPFRSFRRFNPSLVSNLSIRRQSNQLYTNNNNDKLPLSTLLRRYLTSTATADHHRSQQEEAYGREITGRAVHLQCESSSAQGGVCHVYLVGTCHVSQESSREVKAAMRYLKPQAVFLELCQSRAEEVLTDYDVEVPTRAEMFDMWMNENVNPLFIYQSWLFAKTARELGVRPGEEFRVAYDEARSYGARDYLGDRPHHITMSRISKELTIWCVIKFLYHTFYKSKRFKLAGEVAKKTKGSGDGSALKLMVKEMDRADGQTVMLQEMSKAFPSLMESLLEVPSEKDGFGILKIFSSVGAIIGKKSKLEEDNISLVDLEEIAVELVEELQDEK